MTFEQAFHNYLTKRGMFDDQAAAVVAQYKAESDDYSRRMFGDSIENFPKVLLAAMLLGLNRAAVQWIDANLPLAWYRPIFTGEAAA